MFGVGGAPVSGRQAAPPDSRHEAGRSCRHAPTSARTLIEKLASARVRGVVYRNVLRVQGKVEPEHEVENKLYGRGYGVLREAAPDGYVELVRCS